MPNVNLTDSRSRDAVVKAETTGVSEDLRYVDSGGNNAYTRKILKATVDHDFATLVEKYDDDKEKLGQALIEGDPEVDMEKCGLYLWGVSKVYVDSEDGIVYRIEQTEIVRDPAGAVKERRPRQRSEANVDMEIPLTWTGRKIDKAEAVRRFVFASKLQIVHINGLTYDFLYGMASELAESNSLMMIGGGSKGRDPLIFRSGSIPYRGFLEGRVDGEKYILLLHLSNMELKQLEDKPEIQEQEKAQAGKDTAAAEVETEAKAKTPAKDTTGKTAKKAPQKKAPQKKTAPEEELPDKEVAKSEPAEKEKPEKRQSKKKIANKKSSAEKSESEDAVEQTEAADPVAKTESNKPKTKTTTKAKKSDEKTGKKGKDKPATDETAGDKSAASTKKDKVAAPAKVTAASVDESNVSSQDLGVWLKSIRMGKYLKVFVDNEIDVDVLTELTDADLKELEIPLGSRRRLLKAVSEADNLRAEVVMAVQTMSGSKVKNN